MKRRTLSGKEKRKKDLAKRQTRGEGKSVPRKPENSRACNRRKLQDWKRELPTACDFFSYFFKNILTFHLMEGLYWNQERRWDT